jgi:Tol biopolymer transport system component
MRVGRYLALILAAVALGAPAAAQAGGTIVYERAAADTPSLWAVSPGADPLSITSCLGCLAEGAEVVGARVYFDSDMVPPIHVWSSKLDGSDLRQVTFSTTGFEGYPTVSPDRLQLAYDGQSDDLGADQGIYVAPVDAGTPPVRVEAPPKGSIDTSPEWSPDGQLIAFQRIRLNGCGWRCRSRGRPEGYKSAIYLMRPDGSHVRRLTPDDGRGWADPSWAPDSRQLLIQSYDDRATRQGIGADEFTIGIDGRGVHAITHSRGEFWFSGDYSPDGQRIAVMHIYPEGFDLVDMAADGSDARVVANCDVWCDHPNW